MRYFNILTIFCGLSLAMSTLAFGSDFHSPRTAALGGAGHAGPLLNDAIYLNPAFASFLPSYSLGFNYGYRTSENRGHNLNISIQDGRSELFQAGVAYTRREDARIVNVGVSRAVIKELGFGIGLGGKFVMPNLPNGGSSEVLHDMIVSISGAPISWLQGSLVIDNLFQGDSIKSHGFYREFILGTKFNVQGIVLLYLDPHYTPSLEGSDRFGHEFGVEFPVMKDFFFRLGNFRNAYVPVANVRGRGYGIGVGWIAPRISMDYGIQRVVEPTSEVAHHFGFTVYF